LPAYLNLEFAPRAKCEHCPHFSCFGGDRLDFRIALAEKAIMAPGRTTGWRPMRLSDPEVIRQNQENEALR